jgi:alkylation response protein AidB-like acyl-CoA dehydrogenase
MTHDVSDTEVQSGQAKRVHATEAEARQLAEEAREAEWHRPSFAKGLYLGSYDLSLVHPHPRPAAEDAERGEAFLSQLRAVCEKLDGQRIERDDLIPDEYLAALSEIGTFGMKIPREYGGLGLTMAYYGKALMMIGSVHPSLGALISAHQSIGVPEPVKMFGSEDQKQRFLPRCAGGAITAFLLTRPGCRRRPRSPTTVRPTCSTA